MRAILTSLTSIDVVAMALTRQVLETCVCTAWATFRQLGLRSTYRGYMLTCASELQTIYTLSSENQRKQTRKYFRFSYRSKLLLLPIHIVICCAKLFHCSQSARAEQSRSSKSQTQSKRRTESNSIAQTARGRNFSGRERHCASLSRKTNTSQRQA